MWWLGWLVAPRILVAILATISYFEANPVLVVIAWLVALGGESSEKSWVRRRTKAAPLPAAQVIRPKSRRKK